MLPLKRRRLRYGVISAEGLVTVQLEVPIETMASKHPVLHRDRRTFRRHCASAVINHPALPQMPIYHPGQVRAARGILSHATALVHCLADVMQPNPSTTHSASTE